MADSVVQNKKTLIMRLPEAARSEGFIKFNIPDGCGNRGRSGEGVLAWCQPSDKQLYLDNEYYGKIAAIICGKPSSFKGRLEFGDEVVLRCNGEKRPTLDPEWIAEHLA